MQKVTQVFRTLSQQQSASEDQSSGSSDGSELSEETSWPAFESSLESEDLAVHLYPGAVTIQGVLRRKTLLKEGKKPTVASWTKYWVALCGTQLFYYAAKSLKATERKHFKSTPSKNVSVVGWMVMMADDPEHPDLFLLTDSEKDTLFFMGETEYCRRSFFRCVAGISGVVNDNTENVIATCYNE
ncbi:ras-specific guanine nucleotide-releasing factor 2 isoform x2 [Limosa lapponica baueri]|uniref:Ras-specific guanine nucleotide-releasing factor 2 isoform x2 n=1 Tax=Limosa lapponica baueri TaxID=1758121 RepID=A0A2I0TJ55_LIMLA|nr:ras-specific guanine nucleotide-releasing factor 2 isoform x2 [Limosa lapponica baueri]